MSIAEVTPGERQRLAWDWKEDELFLQQLREDLRRQAIVRIRSGIRSISVSSLVQESLIKLLASKRLRHPEDRSYLYAMAARVMRHVIVDHVRAQQALKRRRNPTTANLDALSGVVESNHIDILAIHEALEKLSSHQPRQALVVEMKFFAGSTMDEIADHLDLGRSTVEGDWTKAKDFLTRFLSC
jgi:RNA polymerase sigma factor (TIGR02999 family)